MGFIEKMRRHHALSLSVDRAAYAGTERPAPADAVANALATAEKSFGSGEIRQSV